MRFNYVLDGAGWATATLQIGNSHTAMTASFLHDSLRQLAEATLALETGQDEAAVVFMSEPGEHHLVLRRVSGDGLTLEVRWFDDWASWGMNPTDQYQVVLKCTSALSEFKTEVIAALGRVLAQHGLEGYKHKWVEHEFPVAAYEQLSK